MNSLRSSARYAWIFRSRANLVSRAAVAAMAITCGTFVWSQCGFNRDDIDGDCALSGVHAQYQAAARDTVR